LTWLRQKDSGFTEKSQLPGGKSGGSHRQFEGPNGGKVTVAAHNEKDNEEIPAGTLSAIRRQIRRAQEPKRESTKVAPTKAEAKKVPR
jgi:predicted RNA binding protein YcfA (HicA-like mRNA interferase family)